MTVFVVVNRINLMYMPVVLLLLNIGICVWSGIPISYPGTLNSDVGGKILPYNLIDVYPSCYERGLCPMFPPGGPISTFPNSEEKIVMLFHDLFRMNGNCSLSSKWGKWQFGANPRGGLTYFCPSCKYCGDGKPDKAPLYWYSDANQVARFKQYDEKSCDQDWYNEPGISAHHTCNWVLPEYGGGSHCDLFNGCSYGDRSSAFCEEDRCWFETEGICGANSCYFDPHCEPIFAAKYDYQGAGFVEGMNGVDTQYVRFTKEIFYLLPGGGHFDERMKIVPEDYHPENKHFTLMLEYFDHNHTQKADKCWSLYNGIAHEMEVGISWNTLNGTSCTHGFGKDSWSVIFVSYHYPPEMTCEPYSFICKTTLGNFFRLPEEGNYYFGTEWIDWYWSDYEGQYNLKCKENHYYYDGTEWLVNGGPELKKCDIWYYNDLNYSTCIGCSKIAKLDCISNCIYGDNLDNCNCNNIIGQNLGNEWCTPSPTRNPLIGDISYSPTPSPTPSPTDPTTARPSNPPTYKPTRSPLPYGQTYAPTIRPSKQPLPAGYTHNPTPSPDNDQQLQTTNHPNFGAIAAVIILVLICLICCLAWIYFRIHTGKPLYPTKSEIKLPRLPGLNSNRDDTDNKSQMSTQISHNDTTSIRKQQSIRTYNESDEEMEEGSGRGAHYKTGKVKSKSKKKHPPSMRPPPPPTTTSAHVTGLQYLGDDNDDDNDDNDNVNEATPLSQKEEHNMQYPETNDILSIEEAKNMDGGDKENYLSDEDFKTVFGMSRDEFHKLPSWKQKNAKKKHGFF